METHSVQHTARPLQVQSQGFYYSRCRATVPTASADSICLHGCDFTGMVSHRICPPLTDRLSSRSMHGVRCQDPLPFEAERWFIQTPQLAHPFFQSGRRGCFHLLLIVRRLLAGTWLIPLGCKPGRGIAESGGNPAFVRGAAGQGNPFNTQTRPSQGPQQPLTTCRPPPALTSSHPRAQTCGRRALAHEPPPEALLSSCSLHTPFWNCRCGVCAVS